MRRAFRTFEEMYFEVTWLSASGLSTLGYRISDILLRQPLSLADIRALRRETYLDSHEQHRQVPRSRLAERILLAEDMTGKSDQVSGRRLELGDACGSHVAWSMRCDVEGEMSGMR